MHTCTRFLLQFYCLALQHCYRSYCRRESRFEVLRLVQILWGYIVLWLDGCLVVDGWGSIQRMMILKLCLFQGHCHFGFFCSTLFCSTILLWCSPFYLWFYIYLYVRLYVCKCWFLCWFLCLFYALFLCTLQWTLNNSSPPPLSNNTSATSIW